MKTLVLTVLSCSMLFTPAKAEGIVYRAAELMMIVEPRCGFLSADRTNQLFAALVDSTGLSDDEFFREFNRVQPSVRATAARRGLAAICQEWSRFGDR